MALLDISNLLPSGKLLDEDKYWEIIQDSLDNTENIYEQEEFLINRLSEITPEEMIGFRLRTDSLLYHSYTSELWCAGYIIQGGCSDDGFEYFRLWVISRGKEVYYNAKTNPDSLINELDDEIDEEEREFEGLWYVALRAFEIKTGKELYDYIDYDNVKERESLYPRIKFTWEESNPDSMKAICPQLYAYFEDNIMEE